MIYTTSDIYVYISLFLRFSVGFCSPYNYLYLQAVALGNIFYFSYLLISICIVYYESMDVNTSLHVTLEDKVISGHRGMCWGIYQQFAKAEYVPTYPLLC